MSVTMRAKFLVNAVKRYADSQGNISSEEINLSPVTSDRPVNKVWSKWTPCGSFSMTFTNPNIFNKVLPGQFYFIDLTLTDKDG